MQIILARCNQMALIPCLLTRYDHRKYLDEFCLRAYKKIYFFLRLCHNKLYAPSRLDLVPHTLFFSNPL